MNGLSFGPFSFSLGLMTTFAAVFLLQFVGGRLARARAGNIDKTLWLIILAALVAARLTYVARHAQLYALDPVTILDIRDGGFHLLAGLCAGLATAALLGWRQPVKRVPLLAGALAGASMFGLVALLALALPAPTVRMPQLTLARPTGGTLSLPSLAGKPVVLNLWASWCPPCRREMPVLRQAQLAHPEVHFIFVNQGETPAQIAAYLKAQHIELDNIVLDARPGLAHVLDSKALPSTFFFDSTGVLVERRVGQLSAATLSDQLSALK
jgi:thiol-disulfide isomerase/thioredoxin